MQTNDLIAGLDLTGTGAVTGAQLSQLVNSATPQTDRGFCLVSTDVAGNPVVPAADATTAWQRYIWLRITASQTIPYVWNPAGANDATYKKWQTVASASIGVGTIVNQMIADNTIQDVKIANLSYSKLTGAPSGLPPSGAASGDLTGAYPNPTIAANAVTTAKIADGNVTAGKIAVLAVDYTKLIGDGVAKDMLRSKSDGTVEWFVPPVIFTSGVVVPAANALKIPQVNAGATDFQMQTVGTLNQQVSNTYVSGNIAITAAAHAATAHNLGAIPQFVRGVLVCIANDQGYSIGDEIGIECIGNQGTSPARMAAPFVGISANATNITYQFVDTFGLGGLSLNTLTSNTGVTTAITPANWKLKIYARL